MPTRKPPFRSGWQRYEVALLVDRHLSNWADYCREADRSSEGPVRYSHSEKHQANMARPPLETSGRLLDLALSEVGPVQHQGRLFTRSQSISESPVLAGPEVPSAVGLFVEIHSPINGEVRRVR